MGEKKALTDAKICEVALRPEVNAAFAIERYSTQVSNLNLTALVSELKLQSDRVQQGDLARGENMLVAQAHTLDAIFTRLVCQALDAPGLDRQEIVLRLAFKAQAQCRTTLETLAGIKNPQPVAFVRQANISAGPQQINNAAPSCKPARARKYKKPQNKLLEADNGKRLDIRSTGATVFADPELETVGKVDRSS